MNKGIDLLTKTVYPVTGSKRPLTVEDVINILSRFPKEAKMFALDTEEDFDVPVTEPMIIFNEVDNEVFIDITV